MSHLACAHSDCNQSDKCFRILHECSSAHIQTAIPSVDFNTDSKPCRNCINEHQKALTQPLPFLTDPHNTSKRQVGELSVQKTSGRRTALSCVTSLIPGSQSSYTSLCPGLHRELRHLLQVDPVIPFSKAKIPSGPPHLECVFQLCHCFPFVVGPLSLLTTCVLPREGHCI